MAVTQKTPIDHWRVVGRARPRCADSIPPKEPPDAHARVDTGGTGSRWCNGARRRSGAGTGRGSFSEYTIRSSWPKKKPRFSEKAGFLAIAKCSKTCERVLSARPLPWPNVSGDGSQWNCLDSGTAGSALHSPGIPRTRFTYLPSPKRTLRSSVNTIQFPIASAWRASVAAVGCPVPRSRR